MKPASHLVSRRGYHDGKQKEKQKRVNTSQRVSQLPKARVVSMIPRPSIHSISSIVSIVSIVSFYSLFYHPTLPPFHPFNGQSEPSITYDASNPFFPICFTMHYPCGCHMCFSLPLVTFSFSTRRQSCLRLDLIVGY